MASFENCHVHAGQSLYDVLCTLDRGACGIALVVDDDSRLVGTMTDGDVRRALLSGFDLGARVAQHMTSKAVSVGPDVGRAEVLDLMRAHMIEQIPIVDRNGRLLGLHLIHEILGAVERRNWAIIMAGGLGKRLRPLTELTPKPMLMVAGRPILERLVLHLVGFGIRRIFLAIGYLGHVIEQHFEDGTRYGCRIEYIREETPLGTGGALALLSEVPSDPLIVLNGDLVTQVCVPDLLSFHGNGGFVATVAARNHVQQIPFGCLTADADRLLSIEEKPSLIHLINSGIYVISSPLMRSLPKPPFPLPHLLLSAVQRGEPVGVFQMADSWIDVGRHDELRRAREGDE